MSSPFDQEAPAPKKAKKTLKLVSSSASNLSSALKASGAALPPPSSVESETLAAEPAITAKIRANISKIVNGSMMAKRSAVISKIEERMFPDLKDASDEEQNSVYGTINLTIATMVHEEDLQEFKFLREDGSAVESMLVKPGLVLEGASFDQELPEVSPVDDLDVRALEDEDFGMGGTMPMNGDKSEARDDLGDMPESGFDTSPQELSAYLASCIGGWCVTHHENGKTIATMPPTAAGALSVFTRLSETQGAYPQVWGMLPIDVEVKLGISEPVNQDALDIITALPSEEPSAATGGDIDVDLLPDEDSTGPNGTVLDNQE